MFASRVLDIGIEPALPGSVIFVISQLLLWCLPCQAAACETGLLGVSIL